MNIFSAHSIVAVAVAGVFAAASHAADPGEARTIIEDWPEVSKSAAETMLEKYGDPDGATQDMLIWNDNGPWLQTRAQIRCAERSYALSQSLLPAMARGQTEQSD